MDDRTVLPLSSVRWICGIFKYKTMGDRSIIVVSDDGVGREGERGH